MNLLKKTSKIHYAWWVMVSCIFILAGNIGILQNCLGVFMTPVSEALGIPITGYALAITINSLVLALGTPLASRIVATRDTRRILITVVTIECIAYFCNSLWSTIYGWYLTSVIIGFCQCFISFLIVPHLMNVWFKKSCGLALGIACCGTSIGSGVFQALSGALISNLGYKPSYQILAAIAWVLSGPIAFLIVRSKPEDIGLSAYGQEEYDALIDSRKLSETTGFTLKEVSKMPVFYVLMLIIIFLTMGISFQMQLTTFLLSHGLSMVAASSLSGISISVGGVIGNLVAGILNDRYGVRVGIISSILIGCIGLLLCLSGLGGISGLFVGVGLFGFIQTMIDMSGSLLTRAVFGTRDFDRIYAYICIWIPITTAFSAYVYSFLYTSTGTYDSAVWLAFTCSLAAAALIFGVGIYAKKHLFNGANVKI